jgi:hypothetical protein
LPKYSPPCIGLGTRERKKVYLASKAEAKNQSIGDKVHGYHDGAEVLLGIDSELNEM